MENSIAAVFPMEPPPDYNEPKYTTGQLEKALGILTSKIVNTEILSRPTCPLAEKVGRHRLFSKHTAYQLVIIHAIQELGIRVNHSLISAVCSITPGAPHMGEQAMFGEPPASIVITLSTVWEDTMEALDDLAV